MQVLTAMQQCSTFPLFFVSLFVLFCFSDLHQSNQFGKAVVICSKIRFPCSDKLSCFLCVLTTVTDQIQPVLSSLCWIFLVLLFYPHRMPVRGTICSEFGLFWLLYFFAVEEFWPIFLSFSLQANHRKEQFHLSKSSTYFTSSQRSYCAVIFELELKKKKKIKGAKEGRLKIVLSQSECTTYLIF